MRNMRFLLILLGFFLCLSQHSLAHLGSEHTRDFIRVFNGYGDENFKELCGKLTTGIDHHLPNAFRANIGEIPGNHRVIGHAWGFNDSIPSRVLEELERKHPGKKTEITKVWSTFVNNLTDDSIRITGLRKNQARALLGLLHDIHLLGDLEPGNTRIDLVLKPEEITNNIIKNSRELFRNHPEYAQEIRQRLLEVLRRNKGKDVQVTAERLLDEMGRLNFGGKLNQSWKSTLKVTYSADRAATALANQANRIVERTAKRYGGTLTKAEKRLTVGDFRKARPRGKLCPGLITNDGRLVAFFSTPQELGLLCFALDSGIATYKYATGNLRKGELEERIKEAAAKGATVGTATAVAVALGAIPGGWVVEGIAFGTYVVADISIEALKSRHISPEDMKAFESEVDSILGMPIDSVLSPNVDTPFDPPIDSPFQPELDTPFKR